MKAWVATLSLVAAFAHASTAQQSGSPFRLEALYGSAGSGQEFLQQYDEGFFVDPMTGTLGITAFTCSGFGLAVHKRALTFVSRHLPDDYDKGSSWGGRPTEKVRIYALSAVWKYQPFKTPLLRLGVEAGPALLKYWRSSFTPQPVTTSGGFVWTSHSSNYSHQLYETRSVGLNLAVRAEAPLSRGFGFEYSLWSHLNRECTLMGGEFSLTVGVVRRPRPGYKASKPSASP